MVIDQAGIRLIAVIPEDEHVPFALARGMLLSGNCPAGQAFVRLAKRLLGQNAPIQTKRIGR